MCSPLSRLARIRRAELRPIARWAIRAFVALLSPCGGQYALQPGYVLAAVAACAHTPCRIAPYCPLGNTGYYRVAGQRDNSDSKRRINGSISVNTRV